MKEDVGGAELGKSLFLSFILLSFVTPMILNLLLIQKKYLA